MYKEILEILTHHHLIQKERDYNIISIENIKRKVLIIEKDI